MTLRVRPINGALLIFTVNLNISPDLALHFGRTVRRLTDGIFQILINPVGTAVIVFFFFFYSTTSSLSKIQINAQAFQQFDSSSSDEGHRAVIALNLCQLRVPLCCFAL